jgi:hypothetical protein
MLRGGALLGSICKIPLAPGKHRGQSGFPPSPSGSNPTCRFLADRAKTRDPLQNRLAEEGLIPKLDEQDSSTSAQARFVVLDDRFRSPSTGITQFFGLRSTRAHEIRLNTALENHLTGFSHSLLDFCTHSYALPSDTFSCWVLEYTNRTAASPTSKPVSIARSYPSGRKSITIPLPSVLMGT